MYLKTAYAVSGNINSTETIPANVVKIKVEFIKEAGQIIFSAGGVSRTEVPGENGSTIITDRHIRFAGTTFFTKLDTTAKRITEKVLDKAFDEGFAKMKQAMPDVIFGEQEDPIRYIK